MCISENLAENDVKNVPHDFKRRPDVMHEISLTPRHVRRHFLSLFGFMEIPVGYARKDSGENREQSCLVCKKNTEITA